MSAPLLLDLTHTCHTRARTGIQRVARSLHHALGERARAITHDPHLGAWREIESWENANLTATAPSRQRGARWPLSAQIRGVLRRRFGRGGALPLPANAGVVVPEVFSPSVARALPSLFTQTQGPKVALFHDAIALRFPELTPTKTVARFPAYMVELLGFDGIAAVSEDSRAALLDYWQWLGADPCPPVAAIPLGVDPHHPATPGTIVPAETSLVLCVGSIEGRKNHLALLEACETIWAAGGKFSLHLIGLAQPATGAAALARIRALQDAGRPLRYDGPVSEAALAAAYAACTFTVYPSQVEGFGLPVIESLVHGKPCICSARGALGESARGGGCVALDTVDAPSLATSIQRLMDSPAELGALAEAARRRRFRTWRDYAHDLTTWVTELPPRK